MQARSTTEPVARLSDPSLDSVDSRGSLTARQDKISFPGCADPTVGVELEMSLVDRKTRQLSPSATAVLEALGDDNHFKPELFESIVEINTGVCANIGEVRRDLQDRLDRLMSACDSLGLGTMCTGTHPFADWRHMPIAEGVRYKNLVESMQWPARRLLICGVHVHVGVRSGEHAIAIMNSLGVFMPHLLNLSASSPFWAGQDTGMASARVKVFESLPTAGLQPRVTNWSEFVQLMRTLLDADSISSIREIWWDVRPHPGFGTVEIRICDGINTLTEVCAVAALVQSLVTYLQRLYDEGDFMPTLRNWTLRENKWRAARYGQKARFIRNEHGQQLPLTQHTREWVECLGSIATELGCKKELDDVHRVLDGGPSYLRQRRMLEHHGSLERVVDHLMLELQNDRPYV